MPKHGLEVDPVRRRAGLIGSLSRLYLSARRLIADGEPSKDGVTLMGKIVERYADYVECHNTVLLELTDPEKLQKITESHDYYEKTQKTLVADLRNYIEHGVRPDEESLHAASVFTRISRW